MASNHPEQESSTANGENVRDFSAINSNNQRVEMKGKKNQKSTGVVSSNTVQREEREQLLRQQNNNANTGIEEDLDLQEEGHRVDGRDRLNDNRESNDKQKKHWLWDNWILLALASTLSFSICNMFIGEISDMGLASVEYFCSGSLLFSIAYFLKKREWALRNVGGLLDQAGQNKTKVLLRTHDNEFCWTSFWIILAGAIFQTMIYSAIVFTFKIARQAGLNIGIAQAIWSVNPFLISILERVYYKTAFNFKQVYGMLALVVCAILVSLSEVFGPEEEMNTDPAAIEKIPASEKTPVWAAVCASFVMPCVCTFFVIVIKYSGETLKLDPKDWTIAYWGVCSLVFQIIGVVAFLSDEGSFEMHRWINGFLASFFNLIGCMFVISCFTTGAPIGPASALVSTQTILVVIFSAIAEKTMPGWMQILGLLFGFFGAMLLTIPEQLYALYRTLTCRPIQSESK